MGCKKADPVKDPQIKCNYRYLNYGERVPLNLPHDFKYKAIDAKFGLKTNAGTGGVNNWKKLPCVARTEYLLK